MKQRRLIVEVSDKFHHDLKKRALSSRMTMKSYILGILIEHIKKGKNDESGNIHHNNVA